jgi:monooxygenase
MRATDTDICVVGGGPAGLTLALLLLRSGVSVTVMERSRSLDREYRGEILQPGGMALLARLGVLDGARQRGAHEHDRFKLTEGGRALLDIDYRRLPPPHNCLLSIPQRHLLEELLDQCREHEGFAYLAGCRVTELIGEDGRVRGAIGDGQAGREAVTAQCVVAADGRYSKVRRLAGIDTTRLDVFAQDVLWFKLPSGGRPVGDVQIVRSAGNPVLLYDSYPGHVQVGWALPHRTYPQAASRGVDWIKAQIAQAIPDYAEQIQQTVTRLSDLTLLDVFAATADEWVRDGLVLIGDAAHSHSPIGAQGINLAIQDAVALHPILVESVRTGDAGAPLLSAFPALRRRDVTAVMKLQVLQTRAMLSHGKFAGLARARMARLLAHTPLYAKILRRIAYGNERIQVSDHLFTATTEAVNTHSYH